MRIGILTDIHGDWETMARVLDRLEAERVDRFICLGDLVVHGPAPNRVVDWFRARPEVVVVKGNHDIGATIAEEHLDDLHFFSADSRGNTRAARQALTDENKAYLAALPLEVQEGEVCYTHAARGNPFALLRRPETIWKSFATLAGAILIAGHTHRSRVHHWPAERSLWCTDHPVETGNRVLELEPGDRYIINVGCTAQLKYDPHPPVCAVFEPHNLRLEFHELQDLRG